MHKFQCRLCKDIVTQKSLLTMSPFPKAAQFYPEKEEFSRDKGITLNIYQCSSCNLLQLSDDTEIVSYYKEVITAASISPTARNSRLNEFQTFVKKFNLDSKKTIEVGCGKGAMVGILNDAGLDAIGLEYNKEFVNIANENNNSVIQGYLTELDKSHHNLYDVFISLNYIEHQPDTKAFIKMLYAITTQNAVGYVTAPNVEYLLRTDTLYEFVADHLIYFTQESMQLAFEMNGFKVIKNEIINNENDIALTLKKRVIKNIEGKESVNSLIEELNNFVEEEHRQQRKIAIWGAGHRTLALLAIAKLKNISAIVDSADFKQGKFSPVTHIKIISPLELENSDIDTVIVMLPGIYPDEVIKSIKKFKKVFKTLKLEDNTLVEVL